MLPPRRIRISKERRHGLFIPLNRHAVISRTGLRLVIAQLFCLRLSLYKRQRPVIAIVVQPHEDFFRRNLADGIFQYSSYIDNRRYGHGLPIGISPLIRHDQAVIRRPPHAGIVMSLIQKPRLIRPYLRCQGHCHCQSQGSQAGPCPCHQLHIIIGVIHRQILKIKIDPRHPLGEYVLQNILNQIVDCRRVVKYGDGNLVVERAGRIQRRQYHQRAHPRCSRLGNDNFVFQIDQFPVFRKTVAEG